MIIFALMFFACLPESIIALYGLEVVMPVMIHLFFPVFTLCSAYHLNI